MTDNGRKPRTLTLTYHKKDEEFEHKKAPLEIGIILRLMGYTKPYALARNSLIAIVILRAVQLAMLAWVIGAVIDGPIASGDVRGIIFGTLGFFALAAFTQFTLHFRQKLALQIGEHVIHDLREEIFQHLLHMPIGFYDRTKLGRIISRVTSDVESVRFGVQNALFVSMVQLGQMLVAAGLMLWLDPVLFSILLAMGPVIYLMNHYFRKRMSEASREVQESFSRVTSTLAESVNGIRVTQGFVRQDVNAGIFGRLVADHAEYNLNAARASAVFLPAMQVNVQLFTAILLVVAGYRVFSPDINASVGTIVQFFFLATIFFQPFQMMGHIINEALRAMAGAERVFHLLDTEPDWTDDDNAVGVSAIKGKVEFQDVSFAYKEDEQVLDSINLTVEPGQMIALVGHTGSGKSTITNLLAKFYLPTHGQIFIDDQEIRMITSDSLHRQMGIIQQDNFLFSGTITENIRLGKPDATDDEVMAAARKLDCLDLIESLPQGFRTEVGEKGGSLSLGQRQIVCFVRAMLADPRIFVLDEATSSVDAMTEARIQKSLATLMQNRTSFVVAHRLSTIRDADEVLVLDHGRIVERGNHIALLERNGVYASLYKQFIKADQERSR